MEEKMVKKLSILFALVFSVASFGDVAMQNWNWNKYNVKFQAPKGWKVTKNEAKKFVITDNKDFTMTIAPWEDAAEDAKGVATKGYNNYPAKDREIVAEQEVKDLKGFEGYIIVAKGTYNGRALWFASLGLIDPESSVNLYTVFAWWDDPAKNEYFADICDKISASFAKMK